eukprot:6214545-Pleurochrysis_carterae.AAC.4
MISELGCKKSKQASVLLLCRHGETSHNKNGILQGQLDTALNDTGLRQAQRLGARLLKRKLEMPLSNTAYSSDLGRAAVTGRIVLEALGSDALIVCDARLRERHLGPFQGLSEAQASEVHSTKWVRFISGREAEGVETTPQVVQRAVAALTEIADKNLGRTVLVFSHGGFIHCALSTLTPGRVPHIANCSISELRFFRTGQSTSWTAAERGEGDHVPSGSSSAGKNVDVPVGVPGSNG